MKSYKRLPLFKHSLHLFSAHVSGQFVQRRVQSLHSLLMEQEGSLQSLWDWLIHGRCRTGYEIILEDIEEASSRSMSLTIAPWDSTDCACKYCSLFAVIWSEEMAAKRRIILFNGYTVDIFYLRFDWLCFKSFAVLFGLPCGGWDR